MNGLVKGSALFLGISCLATASFSQDQTAPLVTRDTVVPAVFNDALSMRDNQVGDGFSVSVTDDNGIFPKHSKIEGHVVRMRWATRFRPASMDLKFDDVLYPDGHVREIDAVPVPLDSHGIHRGKDGRMYMNMDQVNPGAYWAAGTVGGLIVGGIFHRPLLGGFLGGFIGAIAAAGARQNPDNYRVARKGDKIGVFFHADVPVSVATVPNPATAHQDGEVRLGDHVVEFPTDQHAFWNGDSLMVPLPVMADQMDLTVDQREDGPIYIENEENMLHLEQGSDQYRLNGARGTLHAAVENRDGVTYVPVEILAAISTRNVYVNGTKLQKKA